MISLANISIKVLDNLRENVDHEFKKIFKEAQVMNALNSILMFIFLTIIIFLNRDWLRC